MGLLSSIKEKIKNHQSLVWGGWWTLVLWFLLWAGYDTNPTFNQLDVHKVFSLHPYSVLELFHGLRAFLPLVAMIVAAIFLIKKKKLPDHFFLTPLGLLSMYAFIGAVASVFSKNPLEAFYSAVLYGTIIVVLLAMMVSFDPIKKLSFVMNMNWVIAGSIAIGLVVFFLLQPGVLSTLTPRLLLCGNRPFEGLAGVSFEVNTLGAAGTRPTGLGRYAGVIAIVCFFIFCCNRKKVKFFWLVLFLFFLAILIFARGRTEIVGFLVAVPVTLLLGRNYKYLLAFGIGVLIFFASFFFLYRSVCSAPVNNLPSVIQQTSPAVPTPKGKEVTTTTATTTDTAGEQTTTVTTTTTTTNAAGKKVTSVTVKTEKPNAIAFFTKNTDASTLSGRTTGIWPEAWHLFLTSPLLGRGFLADRFFLDWQHAHNTLLQTLIQAGILGTIPFVLACIITFIFLYRSLRTKNIKLKEKCFFMMVTGVFVFFAVRALTESSGTFYSADWLFLAPIVAYASMSGFKKSDTSGGGQNVFMKISGNKVNIISIAQTVRLMGEWITVKTKNIKWIVVTGMHGIVESHKNPAFQNMLNSADLFVPDGISLVWIAKLKGFNAKDRVSGADLMDAFFQEAEQKGYTNYFYGDTDETLAALSIKLREKFPKLKIVGMYSPPFRKLSEQEDREIIEKINDAKPDVLWVGLGLPKQETWIFNHKNALQVPMVVGVGAAFKFLSGKVKRAPVLVGKLGFEWLWRLVFETKTTWKRVLYGGPVFVWLVVKDFFTFDKSK